MPLRNLRINVTLREEVSQHTAIAEHAKILKAVAATLESQTFGEFDCPVYDSVGRLVGQARCWTSTTPSEEAINQYGDRQRIAA